ncbi:MAG: AAC(3) family N-acetyltransferase [Desulfuromonadales bacterium]|nr:AAC(3) family N-acetyltransferase [Desulfuromonadales bacterium]
MVLNIWPPVSGVWGCCRGRRLHEMLDDHGLDGTPCGPHSPFRKLAETNGKIILLGCGLRPNTTMHALEEIADPPYLFGPSPCRKGSPKAVPLSRMSAGKMTESYYKLICQT